MKARRGMKCSGRFFRSAINVGHLSHCHVKLLIICLTKLPLPLWFLGSRYIYDMYYEKEAISKQLYDWLLKNNYGDANLIAKWKKQGYEKVSYGAVSRPCRASYLWHLSPHDPACLPTSSSRPSPFIPLLTLLNLVCADSTNLEVP